ncbi:MAG: hypothetical protein IJZ36_03460 [Bacilli bacterium]|nr:hypothetical protein [Bacilli bacterium]
MKIKVLLIGLLFCSLLTGCSLATPIGTLNVSFDKNNTSDTIMYKDDEGNIQEFNTDNISEQIDNMLDDVDVPNGTTNEELKKFVYDNMNNLGVTDTITELENNLTNTLGELEDSVQQEDIIGDTVNE